MKSIRESNLEIVLQINNVKWIQEPIREISFSRKIYSKWRSATVSWYKTKLWYNCSQSLLYISFCSEKRTKNRVFYKFIQKFTKSLTLVFLWEGTQLCNFPCSFISGHVVRFWRHQTVRYLPLFTIENHKLPREHCLAICFLTDFCEYLMPVSRQLATMNSYG